MPQTSSLPIEAHLAHFGLVAFRPGQREVIEAVLAGQDCLCIMPTGGGKSLCYQLPSIARSGTTLVISPLIALMKDQVDALMSRGLRATFINSSLGMDESRTRLAEMSAGNYDLVYIAPERLRNKAFLEAVEATRIQLLAVDEAHCISEWGHDFRPDYARLGQLRERLGSPQTIALTATATPTVRTDVVELLRLRSPQVFITGFARPNLHFEVRHVWGVTAKLRELTELLEETPGAGIVYCATRKRCEEVAEELNTVMRNRKVQAYHAGLEPDQRRAAQEQFMSGEVPVIVATNAFGMGIDKSDLRFVVHFDMPGSIEAYYQEAGRAGRDGGDARCVLLFNERDRELQDWFVENAYPPRETIEQVYDFLRKIDADPIELTLQDVKDRLGLQVSTEGVAACEKTLEKAHALERLETRKNMASVRLSSDLPTLVDLLAAEAKTQRKVLRTLERIVGDRRHEYVFFPPGKLEAMTEMDTVAVQRALRELQRLEAFDYVPPFRGRAIRMKIRDLPFAKLVIDFVELDRRKQAELAKVQQVVDFARSRRCRQLEILDYFGDPSKSTCGACDNCGFKPKLPASGGGNSPGNSTSRSAPEIGPANGQPPSTPARHDPKLTAKADRVVRIALSGVARADGRAGKGTIARMLCGSDAKTVKRLGLDKLSTFGLLALWRRGDVESLLDALLRLRLIEQRETSRFRPVVHITPQGRAVMRGEESADVLPLLNSDALARIRTMPAEVKASPKPAAAPTETALPRSSDSHPPHYWTWRLISGGFSLHDCVAIRGLPRDALLDHLRRAVEEGREVSATAVLSSDEINTLEAACRGRAAVSVRTLFEQLHGAISPAAIEFYLAATSKR